MSNADFQELAKSNPNKFETAPHKPSKNDYWRALIKNVLIKAGVEDPENYVDAQKYTIEAQKKLSRRNKTFRHVPPTQPRASTPVRNVNNTLVELTPP